MLLTLNALWFGAGFGYFGLTPQRAVKILVPRDQRDSPLLPTLAASVRFLGGMNLALCVFSVLLLLSARLFPDPRQNALFAGVFGLAHGTQLFFNVPVLLSGRGGGPPLWPVLRGPMLFIFGMDGSLAIANLATAWWLLAR